MMTQEEDPADPLLAAISALRREVIGWIDSRLDILKQGQMAGSRADPRPDRIAPRSPVVDLGVQARPQAPATPPSSGEDPRLRLDALARHLGERLRLAEPVTNGGQDEDRGKTT